MLKPLKEINEQVDKINEVYSQIEENDRKVLAQQFADLNAVNLSELEKEILTYFWHSIDQEPIDTVKYDALEYCMRIKEKNSNYSGIQYRLQRGLYSLYFKKLIENFDLNTSHTNEAVTLTKLGVKTVTSINPKYSQLHLAYRDFIKNKIAVIITSVSFLSGVAGLIQFIFD